MLTWNEYFQKYPKPTLLSHHSIISRLRPQAELQKKWKTIDKWQHQRVWFLLAVSMRCDWSNLWRSIWETIEAGSEARKQNIKKQTLFFASFQIFGFDRWVFGTQLRQVEKRSKYKCYYHFAKSKYKCINVTITLQVEKASKHKCYNHFAVCKSLKVS